MGRSRAGCPCHSALRNNLVERIHDDAGCARPLELGHERPLDGGLQDHLDRHGALRDYAAIKERVVAGVQPNGTAIVGVDDNWGQAVADRIGRAGKRIERVSVRRPLSDGLYVEGDQVMRAAGGTAHAVVHIGGIGSLRGLHNAQNAACATGAALALGSAILQITGWGVVAGFRSGASPLSAVILGVGQGILGVLLLVLESLIY